jgi:hypothetical protein
MGEKTYFGDDEIVRIPSRELTGPREAKLEQLDAFLAQLHLVRLALCGQAVRLAGFPGATDGPAAATGPNSVAAGLLGRVQHLLRSRTQDGRGQRHQ